MTPTSKPRFRRWLPSSIQSAQLFSELVAGVLIAIIEIIFAVSFGSLIFRNQLSSHLSVGIGLVLVTTAILMIVISLLSRIPGVIGTAQDGPVVILAVMAASLVAVLSTKGEQVQITTLLVTIAVASLLTGFFLLALGYFKLGGLARFIPYPVMGGFLAGTGWLLVQGSFGVMAGFTLTIKQIPALLQSDQIILWLPGVAFGIILFWGLRHIRHFLTLPGLLVGAILVFAFALFVTSTTSAEAASRGLLLGTVAQEVSWQPLGMDSLMSADWGAILSQVGNIAIILILSVIGLLLNASALELTVRQDVDLNHELKAAGVANILSGLAGGLSGYQTVSGSLLNYRMGSRGRVAGLLAGVICILILFVGQTWLAYFPKMILGGVLFFLGLDFLNEWVIAGRKQLSRADYGVVILILIVIASTNFLVGVAVGLIATVILFAINYSRVEIVLHALSGKELKSNVERYKYQRYALEELGKQIYILELQGYIFFGTANALLDQVRARVRQVEKPAVRFVILDFRRVSGLDASAIFSFVKCKQFAEAQEIHLILTGVIEPIQQQLDRGGVFNGDQWVHLFVDLDHGLEWCENQLLMMEGITTIFIPLTLCERLIEAGYHRGEAERLLTYLERIDFEQGDQLIHQGDQAGDVYFLERGTVSIYLEVEKDKQVRLQTLGMRTIVGEVGFYLGGSRTASVVAETPGVAYRLSKAVLAEIEKIDPELTAAFHQYVARLLAERLADTTRLLAAMSD